jgi:hypothetical protein
MATTPDDDRALSEDLARRAAVVSGYGDEVFGRITPLEWLGLTLVGVVVPLVLVVWLA